jgi:hypothetical protein
VSGQAYERDYWAVAGMAIAAASAAVASFSGLRGLAVAAGWPAHLAWLLPVTVDAYAMTSTRLWLSSRARNRHARRFAAANSLGAIAGSVTGNAIYHAVSTGLLQVSWPIVVGVGAVPAAVLGLIAHLHALHSRPEPGPTGAVPGTGRIAAGAGPASSPGTAAEVRYGVGPEPKPSNQDGTESRINKPGRAGPKPRTHRPSQPQHRYPTETELMDAARAADRHYRAEHGRPITRDALRAALRVSGPRATELRRRLAATNAPTAPVPDAKEVTNP